MSITVNLTPESEEFIKMKLESGRYDSASQVVEEALHALETEEWFSGEQLEYLKREIALGLKDLEEGRKEPFDEKVLEEIKANGRARLAARKQNSDVDNGR